jgi:predicted nucleotidyltransferase
MTLAEFDAALLATDNKLGFVQKHILHGLPHIFENRENEYFEFRKRIADKFNVGYYEVFIVGSAKLGFSYHKKTRFSYESDIDVVIVNERLFEDFFKIISDYQYEIDKNHRLIDQREKSLYQKFLQYLVKGWMRPDKLPTSFQVDLQKNDWFEFFDSISYDNSEVGNYKVAAGLYKNYQFLERYYISGITEYSQSISIQNG